MLNIVPNQTDVPVSVVSQFKQLRSSPKTKKGFLGVQWDSNLWPLCLRCSALAAKL